MKKNQVAFTRPTCSWHESCDFYCWRWCCLCFFRRCCCTTIMMITLSCNIRLETETQKRNKVLTDGSLDSRKRTARTHSLVLLSFQTKSSTDTDDFLLFSRRAGHFPLSCLPFLSTAIKDDLEDSPSLGLWRRKQEHNTTGGRKAWVKFVWSWLLWSQREDVMRMSWRRKVRRTRHSNCFTKVESMAAKRVHDSSFNRKFQKSQFHRRSDKMGVTNRTPDHHEEGRHHVGSQLGSELGVNTDCRQTDFSCNFFLEHEQFVETIVRRIR